MNTNQGIIIEIMEAVAKAVNYERAAVCARDMLKQWDVGGDALLYQTAEAWRRYLRELEAKDGHTVCNRHGAWVPAIPL